MHDALQHWMTNRLQQPGIRAFGVRLPDKTCFSHSFAPEFQESKLDNTWHVMADTMETLQLHRLGTHRLKWHYDNANIFFARRPDGVALGLVTASSPLEIDPMVVEELLNEFLALTS